MLPGATEATLDAGHEHFIILIRLTLLRNVLAEPQWNGLEQAAARRRLPMSAKVRERLVAWLETLLGRVHRATAMLHHRAAVHALERELVHGLSGALGLATGQEPLPPPPMRHHGFERAVEHIRHTDLSVLSTPDLASAAGVSRRTLEYAFQEQLGLSPGSFIRLLRLHGLRRELLARQLGESTITDVAYHLGFTQLGRLAREYHLTFGERPSDTLARPFSDDAARFWDPAFDPAPGCTIASAPASRPSP